MWSVLSGFEDTMRMLDAFDRQASWRRERAGAPISLTDEGDALVFTADLPGAARADVDVTVEADVLTVRATRASKAPEGYKLVRRERELVNLAQSFKLPCRVDADTARADLSAGILTPTLPKARDQKPRRISLNTAS